MHIVSYWSLSMSRANKQSVIRTLRRTGWTTSGSGLATKVGGAPTGSEPKGTPSADKPYGEPGSPYVWAGSDCSLQMDPTDPLQFKVLGTARHYRNAGCLTAKSFKGGVMQIAWPKGVEVDDVVQGYIADRLERERSEPSGVLGTKEEGFGPLPMGHYCETHLFKGGRYLLAKLLRKEAKHSVGFEVKKEKGHKWDPATRTGDHPCRKPYQRQTGKMVSYTTEYGTEIDREAERADAAERTEDLMGRIHAYAADMDAKDRTILANMLEGKQHKEAAATLGISPQAVSARYQKILATMKERLLAAEAA